MGIHHFTEKLRALLAEAGVPAAELPLYSSHAFRRGSAADILHAHGLNAMLHHGEWNSMQTAMHYVSKDEVDRSALGAAVAEMSDDDF